MNATDLGIRIVETPDDPAEENAVSTFLEIQNLGAISLNRNWRLYFSLGLKPVDERFVSQTLIDGRYGFLEPTEFWQPLDPGKQIRIEIESWLFSGMNLLDRQGFHVSTIQEDGEERFIGAPTLYPPVLVPLTSPRNTWIHDMTPGVRTSERNLPDAIDAALTVIPKPKSAEFTGEWVSSDAIELRSSINSSMADNYELNISQEQITIIAKNIRCLFQANQTLSQLTRSSDRQVPLCAITDKPDFAYRSLFLDIARHFHDVAQLKKVIDAMALYKMNHLQLGISNDEGWRLEIPSIPELTDTGARRSRSGPIYPSWGDGPEEISGFLTRAEFIDLLAYASERQIAIVPEVNLPGHANALLRSFDDSNRYQLSDPEDTSQYRSAQGYSRNVLNVGLEDSYRLAADIIREVAAMYDEAGVSFDNLHLGGDEVPHGAWLHSAACRSLAVWKDEWDMADADDQHAATAALMRHHYGQMLNIVERISPKTRTLFWHEMAPHGDNRSWYNVWLTDQGDRTALDVILKEGFTFIISNASHLYLDMPYTMAADEPGLPWANYIDTRDIFEFDSITAWKLATDDRALGIQAQLWSETVFDSDLMDYYLFPRLLAVAERAWNAKPDADHWPLFHSALVQKEMARLRALGIKPRPISQSD